ncbi:polysaccharide biosynthesis tyrosine autokinase [Marinilabiliaceae bacterium JC017]|nr:polysaccharide biosynthesis tyrosine autokinase [Marinilabiliaceae bacterium JC017]
MEEQTENHQPYVIKKSSGGDGLFDMKRIINLLLHNWYLFIISVPLCLGGVYIYHRYTIPVYRASATILLKSSQDRTITQSGLMEGFGLSPEVRNIENQTFIIKSYRIVKKAIDRLDFGVSYFTHGRIKDTEVYNQSPFRVTFDSIHPQLLNVPIHVTCISPEKLLVKVSTEGGRLHDYSSQKDVGYCGNLQFEKEITWGETIHHDSFSFKITKGSTRPCQPGVDYYFLFRSHASLAGEYRGRLGVSPFREGSSILFISATGTTPGKLIRFLDVLSEVIMENNLERKNDMATRSLTFIKKQLVSVADSLEKVQNELMTYRKSNRFMVPSEYSSKLADQYYDIEKDLKLLQIRKDYFNYLDEKLETDFNIDNFMMLAVSDESNGLVNQLVTQLFSLKEEYELIKDNAEGTNPYIQNLASKVTLTETNLHKAIQQVLNDIKLQENELKGSLLSLDAKMNQLPELEKHYYDIDRKYKLNDAIYTFLLQKHSENQITKASNTPDNEILDTPTISYIVSPNKKNNYSKAFMIGLLLPGAFIVIRELLNNKIRGKDDLEQLFPQLPLMGVIMHNHTSSQDVIHNHPHTIISESFRSLRTKIKFMNCTDESKVISVSSTNTGEGKTFCAQNLACVFSISGKRTVLLGFDMRKPRLTEIFDLKNHAGLSNYLSGQQAFEDIIFNTGMNNLFVIPAGPVPPNPSELIEGERTSVLFDRLRKEFDVIIIDSPPVGLVADGRMLMDYSDCHLYVVRVNHTNKEHMGHTLHNLMSENVKSLGIILNDVNSKEKGYGYYSTEYYGYKE